MVRTIIKTPMIKHEYECGMQVNNYSRGSVWFPINYLKKITIEYNKYNKTTYIIIYLRTLNEDNSLSNHVDFNA